MITLSNIVCTQWYHQCVCPSLHSPMESSPILTNHVVMTLWPLTPVTLATLSVEAPPGLVGVECGVGHLQLVSVSKLMDFVLFVC